MERGVATREARLALLHCPQTQTMYVILFDMSVTLAYESGAFGSKSTSPGLMISQNRVRMLPLSLHVVELPLNSIASKYGFGSEIVLH